MKKINYRGESQVRGLYTVPSILVHLTWTAIKKLINKPNH